MREWLINRRKELGLTQAGVAKLAEISREYYTRIESGARGGKLPVTTAMKISSVLQFRWTLFYEGEDSHGKKN